MCINDIVHALHSNPRFNTLPQQGQAHPSQSPARHSQNKERFMPRRNAVLGQFPRFLWNSAGREEGYNEKQEFVGQRWESDIIESYSKCNHTLMIQLFSAIRARPRRHGRSKDRVRCRLELFWSEYIRV